jgi:hypothetical protein
MYHSSLLDWGRPRGCFDFSDISQDITQEDNAMNATCGNVYTSPLGHQYIVDWKWFICQKSKKCIHIDHHCDLHPHPDCLYEKVKIVKESVSNKNSYILAGYLMYHWQYISCTIKIYGKYMQL